MLSDYYNNPDLMLDFGHSVVNLRFSMEFHMHDLFEIYYFISGDVNYFIENKVYELKRGDLLIMNSSELHKASLQSDAEYERVTVHFLPDWVRELSPPGFDLLECFTTRRKGEKNKINLTKDQMHEIEGLFKKMEGLGKSGRPGKSGSASEGGMHSTAEQKNEGKDVLRLAYFLELLVFINNAFKTNKTDGREHSVPASLEPLFRHIDENLEGDLSLSSLAAKAYMDRFYLSRLFKSSTGISLQDYILYKRIVRAKELLAEGLNVMDVCQASGFNDYSNFIRTFKKLTGIPPGRYGRRFRN